MEVLKLFVPYGPAWLGGVLLALIAFGRETHFLRLTLLTVAIASIFAVFGLYGLSGAGVIRRLPLLETGIYTIATLFLLRAVAEMAVTGHAPLADSTGALAAVGTLYLLGGRRKFGRQESE